MKLEIIGEPNEGFGKDLKDLAMKHNIAIIINFEKRTISAGDMEYSLNMVRKSDNMIGITKKEKKS